MATREELNNFSANMAALSQMIGGCEDLALAHIEVGEPWMKEWPMSALNPPEFQRSRRAILDMSRGLIQQAARMRRNTLSPHLIRAHGQLQIYQTSCLQCPAQNQHHLASQEPFRCLLKERQALGNGGFRFQMDEGGDVREAQ